MDAFSIRFFFFFCSFVSFGKSIEFQIWSFKKGGGCFLRRYVVMPLLDGGCLSQRIETARVGGFTGCFRSVLHLEEMGTTTTIWTSWPIGSRRQSMGSPTCIGAASGPNKLLKAALR